MNNQPYQAPVPQNLSGNRTVIIVIVVIAVICCLCAAVAGVGGAAFYFLVQPARQSLIQTLSPTEVGYPVLESTATPEEAPAAEDTAVPEPTQEPETQPTATEAANNQGQSHGQGLGVSRDAMIDFYQTGGAFKFGEVSTIQGLEVIQATHTWLCVGTNCAAVTLGGPKDDLLVVSIAVPTKPDDSAQTTLSVLLLMTSAARFTDAQAADTVPAQIMDDLMKAQAAGQNLEKKIESSGYIFTETYDATTHNAGLAITRPK